MRSKRPGRMRAGSRTSRRLVAPRTMTPLDFVVRPSIAARSMFSVCSASSDPPRRMCERVFPSASSSSMKMTLGECFSACLNSCLTLAAPRPAKTSTKSAPEVAKNGTPASAAAALASIVFPVPGGPTRSTPLGRRTPSFVYLAGFRSMSTISDTSRFEFSIPFKSANLVRLSTRGSTRSPTLFMPSVSPLKPPFSSRNRPPVIPICISVESSSPPTGVSTAMKLMLRSLNFLMSSSGMSTGVVSAGMPLSVK
mmetsp:Transcript_13118/g.32154  ORF Transcript_13118/g.32154 Transcript_13118/m.32154 type:complete len:253 (+) Transcript_13118:943-1701(+)